MNMIDDADIAKAFGMGWDAYWEKLSQDSNPYEVQELQEQWMYGWLTAQSADMNNL